MTQACADLFERSNSHTDKTVGNRDRKQNPNDSFVAYQEDLRSLLKVIWPTKYALALAIAADISVRHAERFFARKQSLSGACLFRLETGEHGDQILQVKMRTVKEEWWKDRARERKILQHKKAKQQLERELQELERD